nr:hypothetical protein [Tanacetum cinerariifolium]
MEQQQQPSASDLLARLAANHLFLNKIEPFRAMILALCSRNPDLLQTIVMKGGRNHELGDAVGTSVWENELNPSVSELKGKASADAINLDYETCLGVLNKVLEVGFKRLKPDLIESDTDVGESVEIEE